jgi:cytochrome c biogenesis protein CcmG, thiol:disulfide interchange protein DsbE
MLEPLRRRRWSLGWLLLILALGGVLVWLATIPLLRADGEPRDGAGVGEPAPELALEDVDGATWSTADFEGRLVWVNFWATSCEPCRTEMPAMERLAAAYPEELLVLGVNWGEGREAVIDFVDRYGITYPILMDPGLRAYYEWAATDGLPRHAFIGPEGTIVREVVGPLEPARMVEIVEELLAG